MLTFIMIMWTLSMTIWAGLLSWTWVFPWAALAGCWYSNLRLRVARSGGQALLWVMLQLVTGIGCVALLELPAHF